MTREKITPGLEDWSKLRDEFDWTALLIGNGSSRAVWDHFRYESLFDVARSLGNADELSASEVSLFNALDKTTNFEAVLNALLISRPVASALALQPSAAIDEVYRRVQKALVAAVHQVHIPWSAVQQSTLNTIADEYSRYGYVFTSNYDLLSYWAIMAGDKTRFKDFFWKGSQFDVNDTKIGSKCTRILYLHGGLHLYRDTAGVTCKEVAAYGVNLLDLFGRRPNVVSLCVTEGSWKQKMEAVNRSDYLSFCFDKLREMHSPIVVFGHGLADVDQHIVSALKMNPTRQIAYGIYRVSDRQVVREKARLIQQFPSATIYFFDTLTHPLGNPALLVPAPSGVP